MHSRIDLGQDWQLGRRRQSRPTRTEAVSMEKSGKWRPRQSETGKRQLDSRRRLSRQGSTRRRTYSIPTRSCTNASSGSKSSVRGSKNLVSCPSRFRLSNHTTRASCRAEMVECLTLAWATRETEADSTLVSQTTTDHHTPKTGIDDTR